MRWVGAFLLMVFIVQPVMAAEPKPLFADDAPLEIQIEAPFSKIISQAKRSTDPAPATISLRGDTPETHTISLAARGNSRREKGYCRFPPLRVRFGNKESGHKPAKDSVFKGQKSLKLVTHCKSSDRGQQYALLEFAAYRMLNVVTEESLKVRLAHIDYVDAGTGKLLISRTGFFIEDMDDAAKRTGRVELDIPAIRTASLDLKAGARTALFQYMISNLDWSMARGPEGSDCCHNTKLMSVNAETLSNIVPVPYDFDQSGLVATNYALPPASVSVNSVKTRVYRGYCQLNKYVPEQAAQFLQNKSEILDILNKTPKLETRNKERLEKYLRSFFQTLSDPKKLESRILKRCLK